MKSSNASSKRDQAALHQHRINNFLCSIRFRAHELAAQEELREAAADILSASRQIETEMQKLASLAKKTGADQNGTEKSRERVAG